ncbi:hypothetical protein C494_14848 [Natronorubrum bangense JCM 10635]|uniref:Uncharacterized protein n=1 Tax=Natronorubrum bangense JCM 10635 TaxID=1227500 RepID=L9W9S8_9EURY|nr:hypothetical protein C494_14848 [Natronorubrum bangense JCM 10635]
MFGVLVALTSATFDAHYGRVPREDVDQPVNRLEVTWFETRSVSSSSETYGLADLANLRFAQSRETESLERPRGTRLASPVELLLVSPLCPPVPLVVVPVRLGVAEPVPDSPNTSALTASSPFVTRERRVSVVSSVGVLWLSFIVITRGKTLLVLSYVGSPSIGSNSITA